MNTDVQRFFKQAQKAEDKLAKARAALNLAIEAYASASMQAAIASERLYRARERAEAQP